MSKLLGTLPHLEQDAFSYLRLSARGPPSTWTTGWRECGENFLGTLVEQSPIPYQRHLPFYLSSNRTLWPKGNQQRTERQGLWKRNLTILSLRWPRYQLESLLLGELPSMLSGFPRSRDPGSQLSPCCFLPLDWPVPNLLC